MNFISSGLRKTKRKSGWYKEEMLKQNYKNCSSNNKKAKKVATDWLIG